MKNRSVWISRICIWIIIIAVLFPIYWILMASIGEGSSFFSTSLFPKNITFDNYIELIKETDFLLWMKNSLKLCFFVSIIQLILTSTAAYAFSRMRFYGRKSGLKGLLVLQVFPNSMAIAAYYIILYQFELADNFWIITMVLSAGNAFNIWLLKVYMDGIPKEIDEAAKMDGAGHLTIFTKILLPLVLPQLAVIFIFSFIATYSEFMISSVFLQTPENYTLAIGLQSFISNEFAARWTIFAAAAVLASIPIVILFMALQKYIQEGLTAGGVKG